MPVLRTSQAHAFSKFVDSKLGTMQTFSTFTENGCGPATSFRLKSFWIIFLCKKLLHANIILKKYPNLIFAQNCFKKSISILLINFLAILNFFSKYERGPATPLRVAQRVFLGTWCKRNLKKSISILLIIFFAILTFSQNMSVALPRLSGLPSMYEQKRFFLATRYKNIFF